MRLSAEGEAFLRYCQKACELESVTLGEISGTHARSIVDLTLAGPTSIVTSRIIPACLDLYREFPNLLLSYRLGDRENRAQLLKKGVVQLAILSPADVVLEMDSKLLKPDRYVLVASAKWRGRRTAEIVRNERILNYDDSDETTRNNLRAYDLHTHSRRERIFANTNFALITLLKAGVGYGTLSAEVAEESVARGDLIVLNQRKVFEDPQALAWSLRREMPPYFRRVIDSIR
jgi:LysR family transcriptional regulator (chromosome initiation inhibitor)